MTRNQKIAAGLLVFAFVAGLLYYAATATPTTDATGLPLPSAAPTPILTRATADAVPRIPRTGSTGGSSGTASRTSGGQNTVSRLMGKA